MRSDNLMPQPDGRQERHLRLAGDEPVTRGAQSRADAAERRAIVKWAEAKKRLDGITRIERLITALNRNADTMAQLDATMRGWWDDE